jgi:membrane associated rhomboid family serine protease
MLNPLPPLTDGARGIRTSYLLAALGVALFAIGSAIPGLAPVVAPTMRGLPPGVVPTPQRVVSTWTVLTCLFVSPSVIDAALATIILVYFGRDVERQLGLSRFLLLYFVSAGAGVGAQLMISSASLAAGTAGAVGVLVVYARLWPLNRVQLFGFTAIGARELLMLGVGYRLLWRFGFGGGSDMGLAALGGLAGGALFCAWLEHNSAGSEYRRRVRSALVGDSKSWSDIDWDAIPREGLHSLNVDELDRVAAKAQASGIRSLTDEERAFVHRLRQR